MRYFVLGDIHANIEGLTACLQDYLTEFNHSLKMREKISLGLKSMGYEPNPVSMKRKDKQREPYDERERIICLGDIVGYGASPNECVELMFALADEMVLGNHDVGLCDDKVLEELGFNLESKEAIKWARKELHPWNREELERLYQQRKYVVTEGNLMFSHGMPKEAEEFYYCSGERGRDARWLFDFSEYQDKIVFMGHSHKPFCFRRSPEGELQYETVDRPLGSFFNNGGYSSVCALGESNAALISIPSAGQPRDGINKVGYVVYDEKERTVTWRRVSYDWEGAAKKIQRAKLPRNFAKRLEVGV